MGSSCGRCFTAEARTSEQSTRGTQAERETNVGGTVSRTVSPVIVVAASLQKLARRSKVRWARIRKGK